MIQKKFFYLFPLLILTVFSAAGSAYSWELPDHVVVRKTFPPKTWKQSEKPAETKGKYYVKTYDLYASTGRKERLFRNVVIWKEKEDFCVKVLRPNFAPETLPEDCLETHKGSDVKALVFKALNSSDSLPHRYK